MFRTIQPVKEKKLTFTKIFGVLTVVTAVAILILYAAALFPQLFRYKDFILETSFSLVVVAIVFFLLTGLSYVFLKSKKGNFTGEMKLNASEIILNGEKYPVSEIEKIRFIGNDIKGEFRGFNSKGTQNEIIITDKKQGHVHVFFEQTQENNLKKLKNILEGYYKEGIITESNYHNILNNTNYY